MGLLSQGGGGKHRLLDHRVCVCVRARVCVCVCVHVCVCVRVCTLSLSVMSDSLQPMGCSPPGSSTEFSRQEYWSGLPFPAPGDLPDCECTACWVFFFFSYILTDLFILPEGQDLQEVHSHGKRDNIKTKFSHSEREKQILTY